MIYRNLDFKLNTARWILLFLSPLLTFSMIFIMDKTAPEQSVYLVLAIFLMLFWFSSILSILILFFYKRTTIDGRLKIMLLIFVAVSIALYLLFRIVQSKSDPIILVLLSYFCVYSIILSAISYLEKAEIMLFWLLIVIVIGFIINRLGISEGGFLIPFAFLLSSLGFIYLFFKSINIYKINKKPGMIFLLFYSLIGILDALLLMKFISASPALNNIYDTIGVMIFLLACLVLFGMLPFSDFIDWPEHYKLSFKRLIITPLILFLFIFSLKFLLPDKTYRNIFFTEYSQKEIIHFGMKDYKIDFSGK